MIKLRFNFIKKLAQILLLGIVLGLSMSSHAQYKFEKEYRIKSDSVPKTAIDLINTFHSDLSIKWYLEMGLNSSSIEAKFKYNKTLFSVEFDTLGNLQDVEYIIKKNDIPSPIYNKIEQKLDSLYQKWSVKKIQISHTGNPTEIIDYIKNKNQYTTASVTYEIVLNAINSTKRGQFQITFNPQGILESIYEILQDKSDHLEY